MALAGGWRAFADTQVDTQPDGPFLEQACRLRACDPDQPARLADRIADAGPADPGSSGPGSSGPEEALHWSRLALANDPASPFRWCDLGDLYLALRPASHAAEYLTQARACFRRAEALAPANPIILQRIANFHYQIGEPSEAVKRSYRILERVRQFDDIIFSSYLRFGVPQPEILARGIPPEPDPMRSYLRFVFARNDEAAATAAWRWTSAPSQISVITSPLALSYVNLLWRQRDFAAAAEAWAGYLGTRAGDYPRPNRIFNGSFETEPDDGNPLDWRRDRVDGVEMERDSQIQQQGEASLRITFQGKQNLDFHHLSQTQPVPPGAYRLQAMVKIQDITTDQGVRLRILDPEAPGRLDVSTPAMTGSSDWHAIELRVEVRPPTRVVRIEVARQPSLKFDNKIAGTLWLDAVSLTRTN